MIEVRPLAEHPDASRFIPRVAEWVHEAGNPYFDWLFGNAAHAREILTAWMVRETSEVHVSRVTILQSATDVVGGFVAMAGDELTRCRKADTLATMQSVASADRAALLGRLKAAGGLFVRVEPDQFYLSKMGVAVEHRRAGLGSRIVQEYLEAGRARGLHRFVLDVAEANAGAIGLYERASFRIGARTESGSGDLAYLSMTLDEEAP